jgi:FtsP/CotA-like multicopper oxidase with cupredoxin domain
MRRLILASTLLLAACATAPQAPPEPQPQPQPSRVEPQPRGLIGLTASQIVGHFGNPALQVREGSSVKLQFRGRACVLDAYLYPSGTSGLRVTHIDTRARSGIDFDQAACIASLEHPS